MAIPRARACSGTRPERQIGATGKCAVQTNIIRLWPVPRATMEKPRTEENGIPASNKLSADFEIFHLSLAKISG
jgi:hypothetical protein